MDYSVFTYAFVLIGCLLGEVSFVKHATNSIVQTIKDAAANYDSTVEKEKN